MAAPNYFSSASPTVVLPPPQQDHYFGNQPYANGLSNGNAPSLFTNTSAFAANASIPPTPGSVAGRKRSRGDINEVEEEEGRMDDGSVLTPIDGDIDMNNEEQASHNQAGPVHQKRPSVSSRKSQRRDRGGSGSGDLAQLLVPQAIREAAAEPLIDQATRVLGISWLRMDSTEAQRITQAAYAKYIQNHYPSLKDVAVWFEYKSIPGYLVQARNAYNGLQEYYIFSDDLTEGRLVTSEPAQLIPRLQMLPALHLAAPGGHIRAEMDPITAAQNEVDGVQEAMVAGEPIASKFSQELFELSRHIQDSESPAPGACAAHSMELD
ncbi:hypothetical protein Tdes44962_MAKER02635 [Teratosphaeria destructans]|uniref:Uncharacterized protein n=1 Tax=Teratosphaeria destructans TaxID=418781 RepID=A0A9W7W349_9PEZI|nr:hypothetical protein Tdes44962_MAKER02635 [Teratosphaeria destructans]